MARLDAATAKFAAELAEDKETSPLEPLKAARTVIRFAENPQRGIAKALVRAAMEKSGGLSPIKVFGLLNEHYGRLWWDWEPETIWATLEAEHALGANPDLQNMVLALQCTVNTNSPFEHWHIFEKVGLAFNLHHVDFGVVQPLSPEEASLTIFILRTIRPRQEFDAEVLGYICAICHEAGLVFMPPELFGPASPSGLLEKIAPDHSGVGHSTSIAWGEGGGGSSELAVLNQVAQLKAIKDYVKERL